jgi:hypothetical protein
VVVDVERSREVVKDREDRMTCWNGSRGGIVGGWIMLILPALLYLCGR